ncbi:MAG: glucosaminidase domain-containing protein [Candidatus Latescibacterota bacterium]
MLTRVGPTLAVAAALAGTAAFVSTVAGAGSSPPQGAGPAVARSPAVSPGTLAAAREGPAAPVSDGHPWSVLLDILGYDLAAITRVEASLLTYELVSGDSLFRPEDVAPGTPLFFHVQVRTAAQLRDLLSRLPSAPGRLARCSAAAMPPDLDAVAAPDRKRLFVEALAPAVEFHNEVILAQRRRIRQVCDGRALSPAEARFLQEVCAHYRLEPRDGPLRTRADTLAALLQRVDVIPLSLALTQAALESGWGTSVLACRANNLFGERAPLEPAPGRPVYAYGTVVYDRFPTLAASVCSYMLNLNSHPAYREFRRVRDGLRARGRPLDPVALAGTLTPYSSRGEAYIEDVVSLLRANGLHAYDEAEG